MRGALPAPRAPRLITSDRQAEEREAGEGAGLGGVSALGINVIRAHPLPADAERVAVSESEPGTLVLRDLRSAEKVGTVNRGVAVHVALVRKREDRLAEDQGVARGAGARVVREEANVLLTVGAQEVAGERAVDPAFQGDAQAAHGTVRSAGRQANRRRKCTSR